MGRLMDNPDQLHTKEIIGETEHLPFKEGWKGNTSRFYSPTLSRVILIGANCIVSSFPLQCWGIFLKHLYFVMESFNCTSSNNIWGITLNVNLEIPMTYRSFNNDHDFTFRGNCYPWVTFWVFATQSSSPWNKGPKKETDFATVFLSQ